MELYKIIATITNTSTTFQLAYLPENFEGIKINQKFSFVNPIGYNPKFSVDTMRIILSDKTAIDSVFNTYGLQSNVTLLIKKLNTTGIGYSNLATFAIDFESYEIQPEFSEFALKSVSAMDYYNEIKNTEKIFELPLRSNTNNTRAYLPDSQTFINYVSLKSSLFNYLAANRYNTSFEANNESKIYNSDTALSDTAREEIYRIDSGAVASIKLILNSVVTVTAVAPFVDFQIYAVIYGAGVAISDILIASSSGGLAASKTIEGEYELIIPGSPAMLGKYLKLELRISSSAITTIEGTLFLDIKKDTQIKVIQPKQYIYFDRLSFLIESFFNGNVSGDDLSQFNFTSANCIMGINREAVAKPVEIMRDASACLGLILNFKLDGSAEVKYLNSYFYDLLKTINADTVPEYKDLSIKYFNELNFKGVEVGAEQKEYDLYTYFENWNKKLTFSQNNRKASEVLDLTLTKLRTDYSGILDYYYKRSTQSKKNSKDLFLYYFNYQESSNNELIYDDLTPRNTLLTWNYFLSFSFQNFGLNTLTISSNGGTEDNLEINGVAQMDNLTLNVTPRLLPIQYDLTCLIENVDYSEKILKINDNGTDVYLFVINAETTDNFSEQKISGLKIQF